MEMQRKLVVVMVLLIMAAAFETQVARSKEVNLCNMSEDDLMTCKPAVIKPNPADPTPACCKALSGADLSCLCSYKHSLLLPTFGIDPDLAMQLPTKCKLTPPANCE